MVKKLFKIKGINYYLDPYMEDYKLLKGKKGIINPMDDTNRDFIICNQKTADLIMETYQRQQRENKIERILK
jgi:hypothetical protein